MDAPASVFLLQSCCSTTWTSLGERGQNGGAPGENGRCPRLALAVEWQAEAPLGRHAPGSANSVRTDEPSLQTGTTQTSRGVSPASRVMMTKMNMTLIPILGFSGVFWGWLCRFEFLIVRVGGQLKLSWFMDVEGCSPKTGGLLPLSIA